MGLLDMLQGMTNAPGGQQGGRGGMSPLTMGVLALLAYKTMKGEGHSAISWAKGHLAAPGRRPLARQAAEGF